MSAVGSINHLHIRCMAIVAFTKKYIYFFFKCVPFLVYLCFSTFGRDMGARNTFMLLLRKTRAQEGR